MDTNDQIITKLDKIITLLEGQTPTPQPRFAYDLPEVTPTDVGFVADGKTRNRDGSLWLMQATGAFSPGGDPVKVPTRQGFGYISPIKTPWIWEAGKKMFGPDEFATWDRQWRDNPYAVYDGGDVKDLIDRGAMNFLLFNNLLQPGPTVQPV